MPSVCVELPPKHILQKVSTHFYKIYGIRMTAGHLQVEKLRSRRQASLLKTALWVGTRLGLEWKCKGVRALKSWCTLEMQGNSAVILIIMPPVKISWVFTKCHLFSQAQEGRHVGKGGTKINDTWSLPIKEREVAWTSWPSLKQTCNTFGILEPCGWELRDGQPDSLAAGRRGHLSYDLKEGVDGWRRSEGSFWAEGTVYPGHSSVAYHEGTTDVKWEQRRPASQEPHRGHQGGKTFMTATHRRRLHQSHETGERHD